MGLSCAPCCIRSVSSDAQMLFSERCPSNTPQGSRGTHSTMSSGSNVSQIRGASLAEVVRWRIQSKNAETSSSDTFVNSVWQNAGRPRNTVRAPHALMTMSASLSPSSLNSWNTFQGGRIEDGNSGLLQPTPSFCGSLRLTSTADLLSSCSATLDTNNVFYIPKTL